jgi:hypothetical protein
VDLTEIVDDHVLACVDRQMAFSDLLGTGAWSVDLEEGAVTFADGSRLRVGLLGSAAPGPNSWLWGWANPASYPAPVLEAAHAVRAYGEAHGVPELANGEVPLGDGWDATRAAVAAVAAAPIEVWLPVEAGGGTQVMLGVHDVPPLPTPAPEPTRLGPVVTQVISLGLVSDWPRALRAYAAFRGGALEDRGPTGDGGRELFLTPASGDSGATLELDELGRARSLSLTRAAAPVEPEAPQRRRGLGRLFGR